jgi:hypothetical protein
MCLKTIIALLARKMGARSLVATDSARGKPQSAPDGRFLGMSGPAQITAPQSRLEHSQWLAKMQAMYQDPRQNPARLPLYRKIMRAKWDGEKRVLARQARAVVNMIFSEGRA